MELWQKADNARNYKEKIHSFMAIWETSNNV